MPEPKRIAERYEIVDELGRGGFAVVYKARDAKTERDVALKVIVGNFTDEPSFVERFRQEAVTAANLSHRNTVPVHDFGEADGVLYLAMALIGEGRTLRDLLDGQAPLDLERALRILTPLAAALDYLHRHDPPLTHRDVKPANVLLEGDLNSPWVVLTDFGLVRSLQASTALTKSGSILGTPAYMAPEQADPKQWGDVTPLSDVYALGVVAYEMLTGRAPFEGGTATVLHAHAYDEPPPPLELLPDLGDDLSDALLHALRKPPAERYPSAGAFVDALQAVAETWTEAAQREATLEQLEAEAKELLEEGEWLRVLRRCTEILSEDPDRPGALEMLKAANQGLSREQAAAMRRRRMEERYQEGLDLLEEQKWKQALAAFKEVAENNPDFRDVREKLALAEDEQQRAGWYDEAIAHAEAERWAEACRAWLRVLRGRLDYRGGDAAERLLDAAEGLLKQHDELQGSFERWHRSLARYGELAEEEDWQVVNEVAEKLSQSSSELSDVQAWVDRALRLADSLERSRRALALYEELAAAFEGGDWQKAVETGKALLQEDPDLQGAQALAALAQQELRPAAVRAEETEPTVSRWVPEFTAEDVMMETQAVGEGEVASEPHSMEPGWWQRVSPDAQFATTYVLGDDHYDASFSIERESGEFMGECGVGISETIGAGEPTKVTALEFWLFDRWDIRTVTKVLMSRYAFHDDSLRTKLAPKGEPVLVEEGADVILKTKTAYMRAHIVEVEYGQADLPPDSFFDRLTVELRIWLAPGPAAPEDKQKSQEQRPSSLLDRLFRP